jgi:hypothetical protein
MSEGISGGSALSAFAALLGGINTQAAYNERQRRLRMQADQFNMEAGVTASNAMLDSARAAAQGFVSDVSSGGFTGSAIDTLNDFQGAQLFNARSIVYRGQTQARNALYEGNVAKVAGKNAMISSVFKAGSSVLGGMDEYRAAKAGIG